MCCPRLVYWCVLIMAVAASWISWNLTKKHVLGAQGPTWFESACGEGDDGLPGGCETVLASPYGYFPAKHSDKADGTVHFPVAMLGLAYYSLLTVWQIGIGAPSRRRRHLLLIPYLLIAAGLAGSAYFLNIMYAQLETWCPWCLVTHVLNLLIAAGFVLMWPRAASAGADDSASAGTQQPQPSGRMVFMTGACALLMVVGEFAIVGVKDWRTKASLMEKHARRCKAEYEELTNDGSRFLNIWKTTPAVDIPGHGHIPVRHAGSGWTAVVFSDFECPFCQKSADFFERVIEPMFAGGLALQFRHYPLHRGCNKHTASKMHPHACLGAKLAEAAHTLMGSAGFWKAHDYLFENRELLKKGALSPAQLAAALGVEVTKLAEAMEHEESMLRIAKDTDAASTIRVNSTPAIFVEGRRVPSGATLNIAFWDRLADLYWKSRRTPRPESTLASKVTATQGIPGQPVAPRPSASPHP